MFQLCESHLLASLKKYARGNFTKTEDYFIKGGSEDSGSASFVSSIKTLLFEMDNMVTRNTTLGIEMRKDVCAAFYWRRTCKAGDSFN
jgi:hypothetical protein